MIFDVLYQQGYKIGIYPSASAISPPFHRTIFANVREFEPNTPGKTSIERDKEITQRVKSFIQQSAQDKKPYFAFVFYDSAHAYNYPRKHFNAPFKPAAKVSHLSLWDEKQQELYHNQYRNALYFIDELAGEILAELKEQNALQNTLLIITSDHGEEFNDNHRGYWGHNGNFTPAQTHVPLLVHWPEQLDSRQNSHTTSHYDIIPTLLHEVLGVKNTLVDYSLGMLLNDTQPRKIILMGSYGKQAVFAPQENLIAVTNRLGFFHLENLYGAPLPNANLEGRLFKKAFAQINHFHHPVSN